MYKRAGRFTQALAQRGQRQNPMDKRWSSIYVEMPQSRRDPRYRLLDVLDREVASVTPSLRKRADVKEPPPAISPYRRGVPPKPQRVYMVLFTLRTNPEVQFVKIGVSAYDMPIRFAQDRQNYDLCLLAESEARGTDAAMIEGAFHAAFVKRRIRPRVPLFSGNTECYPYSEENVAQMLRITSRGCDFSLGV